MKNLNPFLLTAFSVLFWHHYASAQLNVVTVDTATVVSKLRVDSASMPVQKVELLPNTATDMLHIKTHNCQNAHVEVTNADGQMLQSFIMKASETSISTENFASGIYFVRIRTARDTTVRKFSKQ